MEIRDAGLLCPRCNSGTKVYNTVHKENGTTRRYRKCLNCGHNLQTTETVAEKYKRSDNDDR